MKKINSTTDMLLNIGILIVVVLSLFGIFNENVVIAITSWCLLVLSGMYFINQTTKHD